MSTPDSGERTEQATERRLREAYRKGKLSRSQDLTAWFGLGAVAVVAPAIIAAGSTAGVDQMFRLRSVVANPSPAAAVESLRDGMSSILPTVGVMLAAVVGVTLLVASLQGGIHFRRLGRVEQFNVVSGMRRVFGVQALWEGAKALLKTAAIGLALWLVVSGLIPVLAASGAQPVSYLLQIAADGTAALLQVAIAVGIALALLDVFVVMRRNRKHTRMTKREAKDEHKNSEGDPLIRQQRRSRQLAVSRNRMIAAIADADVVVVNPTHVAVALRYEPGKAAPRVVAKGSGVIADRIRTEAASKDVPMVRDIPLARALHAACELGDEIPEALYTAVAHVLVFVAALRRRGSARGVHTLPPRRQA